MWCDKWRVFIFIKKLVSRLFCHGGSENTPNQAFVGFTEVASDPKPPRMTPVQLTELLRNKAKKKLMKNY